jgi:redox-sensitive bicupin YhaK (pirin superfamily)
MKLYRKEDLGHFQNEWLDSRHHFSFGHYYDPKRMGFGNLRVINDDIIEKVQGFAPHSHKDMEIITYVREGTIIHRDSLGNEGRTNEGDVQVMSAGTGITHAEYSDDSVTTKIFQIWIKPRETDLTPSWNQAQFPRDAVNGTLQLLVSGRKQHGADTQSGNTLHINQDASIYGGQLKASQTIQHRPIGSSYLLVSKGSITIDNQILHEGDGAEIESQDPLSLTAITNAEILIIDV